jgi:hypothetical protein
MGVNAGVFKTWLLMGYIQVVFFLGHFGSGLSGYCLLDLATWLQSQAWPSFDWLLKKN